VKTLFWHADLKSDNT